MNKNRLLFFFITAGLLLALILGIYFYRANLGPTQAEAVSLLQSFTEKINSGKLEEARSLMTEDTRPLLREPGTAMGKTLYQKLRLKSVENICTEGGNTYTADVVFRAPDSLKIILKAGELMEQRTAGAKTEEDADQVLAEIYTEILSRDDLPEIDRFCLIRLKMQNGQLLIDGDESLQQALEGGSAESLGIIDTLMNAGQ